MRPLGLTRLVGLAGLASCASLPTFVPDLARRPGPPVRLEGARGPLSAAIVGSPLTTGNRVVLLQDGPATYRAMLSVILAARDHINLDTRVRYT